MKKLTVRLDDNLYQKLIEQSTYNDCSINEYFRKIINANVMTDIKEYNKLQFDILILYKNISNNINQLAKKINSDISENQLNEIRKEVETLWQYLKQ